MTPGRYSIIRHLERAMPGEVPTGSATNRISTQTNLGRNDGLRSYFLIILLLFFLQLIGLISHAHESRPLFIEIEETQPGVFQLQYKIPGTVPEFNLPEVRLSKQLKPLGKLASFSVSDGHMKEQRFRSKAGLNGTEVVITYPVMNPSVSTIVRVSLLNGQAFNQLLGPDEMRWQVPDEESSFGVARQYTVLGVRHILEGWDHLLFLVCLILVAGTGKTMLITITGFTLAHSVTLVLSTLNVINLPVAPVEAVIALSVVFLASEIANNDRESLTYRYPIAVSSTFGLLHGFGFAAVLNDIGLPQTEVPVSLLFFNLGVEVGQILFLGAVLLLYRLIKTMGRFGQLLQPPKTHKLEKLTAYGVGSLASFWMIERLWGFL